MTAEEKSAVEEAVDIITTMLQVTPSHRPDAKSIFANEFFCESLPLPTPPHALEGLQTREGPQRHSEPSRSAFFLALPISAHLLQLSRSTSHHVCVPKFVSSLKRCRVRCADQRFTCTVCLTLNRLPHTLLLLFSCCLRSLHVPAMIRTRACLSFQSTE
jgi:hypothetical protein